MLSFIAITGTVIIFFDKIQIPMIVKKVKILSKMTQTMKVQSMLTMTSNYLFDRIFQC
jgi:hypothetical protein